MKSFLCDEALVTSRDESDSLPVLSPLNELCVVQLERLRPSRDTVTSLMMDSQRHPVALTTMTM